MKPCKAFAQPLLFAIGVLALGGCIDLKPKPDTTRYYVIDEPDEPGKSAPGDCSRTILIGPVRVAGYIDQTPLIERRGEHEIVPLVLHRWSESPGQSLPRTLVRRLSRAMPEACVSTFQRATPVEGTVQLDIEISQFELSEDNHAVVTLRWRAFEPGRSASERAHTLSSTQTFVPANNRVENGVTALSRGLDEVVRQLAAALSSP